MPSDPNEAAALTVRLATEELDPSQESATAISQYLARIGKKGGEKGGRVRAKVLSKKRRIEIAKRAAESRWAKRRESE